MARMATKWAGSSARNRRTRSSTFGCVSKSAARPSSTNGLNVHSGSVAGDAWKETSSDACSIRSSASARPCGDSQSCAARASASYSRFGESSACVHAAATGPSTKSYARWSQPPTSLRLFLPSLPDDPRLFEWYTRLKVQSASPAAAETFMRMAHEIDVRDVAPAIRVPTLILHSVEDQICHVENARFLARTIPGARYVELPGGDHVMYAELADQALGEIREFLTGVREGPEPQRVLATVLFTDLVGSTERAAELGDRRWRELLEAHHAVVRRELERFGGREIDTAGDGFLAAFDGPARAIRCARAVVSSVAGLGLAVRAGVHTGECEVLGEKLAGLAVHVGARVSAQAGPGEVLVSSTVRDLIAGSGVELEDRGLHALKGIDEERRLYAVA